MLFHGDPCYFKYVLSFVFRTSVSFLVLSLYQWILTTYALLFFLEEILFPITFFSCRKKFFLSRNMSRKTKKNFSARDDEAIAYMFNFLIIIKRMLLVDQSTNWTNRGWRILKYRREITALIRSAENNGGSDSPLNANLVFFFRKKVNKTWA